MKSIEDRAHEILLKLIKTDKTGFDAEGISAYAYEIAQAMQAEAEKRKPMPNANPMRKVRESQWQPDWSVAPSWAKWWVKTPSGETMWCEREPILLEDYARLFSCSPAPSFNYQGGWKDSLRKRPDAL